MATVTLNMSDRNPVTLDLAAGWSLLSTSTMTHPDGTLTIKVYTSATPKRVISGEISSTARGTTKYAGYLSTDAGCLTTVLSEIRTVITELLTAQTADSKLEQDVRNAFAATTVAA